jgi:hypothetical protein
MTKSNADDVKTTVFKGNPVLSLIGVLLSGSLIFFGWLTIQSFEKGAPSTVLLWISAMLVFVIGLGLQLFYFELSANRLEIRNHIFWWYKKEYPLQNITGVVIGHVFRQSTHLRINTNNRKSRKFPAGSLREKNWTALGKALHHRHISVRNGG